MRLPAAVAAVSSTNSAMIERQVPYATQRFLDGQTSQGSHNSQILEESYLELHNDCTSQALRHVEAHSQSQQRVQTEVIRGETGVRNSKRYADGVLSKTGTGTYIPGGHVLSSR